MKFYINNSHTIYPTFNGANVGAGINDVVIAEGHNHILLGNTGSLTLLEPNITEPEKGKVAYIGNTYNTGWMHGACKLAALSSNSSTNISDTTLVTNGTFASDTSGWSSGNVSNLTRNSSGELVITATGSAYPSAKQVITVTAGQAYYYSVDMKRGTCTADVHLEYNDSVNSGWQQLASTSSTTMGTFTGTIVPSAGTVDLRITIFANNVTNGHTAIADNIILKLADMDRSNNGGHYQGKALGVVGTVTKSAVATNADLMAYSGFSSSNYLHQDYNPDFQVGTGDFCFEYWVKFSGVAGESIFSTVGTGTSSGTEGVAANTAGSGVIGFAVYNSGLQSSGRTNCGFTKTPVTGQWYSIKNIRRNGMLEMWIDGQLTATAANTDNISATDSFTRIGGWSNGGHADSTSLALFRMSAFAPSPTDIYKSYCQEASLFAPGAQATIYGNSNIVNAIAYDKGTKLLHVGTSAGRSVFNNLTRVDNTTDAISVDISASNDFIVEE